MKISVFSLFKTPSILDEIHRIYGDRIIIDFPQNGKYTSYDLESPKLMKIYTTNLKLFFEPEEIDFLDDIINTFANFNLFVKHEKLVYLEYLSKTIEVPALDSNNHPIAEIVKCPTCNSACTNIKTTTQIINEVRKHTDFRIIFELRI